MKCNVDNTAVRVCTDDPAPPAFAPVDILSPTGLVEGSLRACTLLSRTCPPCGALKLLLSHDTSPGECRVMRIHIQQTCSLRSEYVWEGARDVANYCIVRKPRCVSVRARRHTRTHAHMHRLHPLHLCQQSSEDCPSRNWWRDSKRMFRGLRLGYSPWPTRLVIVYAIDCEHMDDPDYQEQVQLSP